MPTTHKNDQLPTDEQRDEREAVKVLRQVEAQQRRWQEMARKTAEYNPEDEGNLLWAV